MATRLSGQFFSEKNSTNSVIIQDTNYTGDIYDFKATSITINWRGDDAKERFVGLIGSELQISIIIDNQDLQAFIDDLVTAEENTLLINYQYSDIDGLVQNWTGYIVTDLVNFEDIPLEIGYIATITAVDGIGLLKSIDYAIAGTTPYDGFDTFITVILRCIGKLSGIVNFMQTIDTNIFKVVCNWHETSYTYSSNINPLKRSRINGAAFYWVDNKGNNKFYSCYEVLQIIAEAWGARILFSGKHFWFIQVNEYSAANNKTVFSYQINGTETISSGQNLRIIHNQSNLSQSELLRFYGGLWSYYAPLKEVTVDYQHLQSVNLISGFTVNQNSTAFTSDVFLSDADGTTRLTYTGNINLSSEWISIDPFENYFFVFRILLQVGNYRFTGGWTEGEARWEADNSKYYYITTPIITDAGGPDSILTVLRPNFITPFVPAGISGQITFNITAYKAITMSGVEKAISTPVQLPGDIEYTFTAYSNYLEILQLGNFDEQSDVLRYGSESGKGSSKKINIVSKIGDGPTSIAPGHIEVLNNSSAWVLSGENSNGWRVGNTGTAKKFSQLLANEIIRGQLNPVQRYLRGSFQNIAPAEKCLLPHLAIFYDGAYLVTTSCEYNAQTEITTGDWFRLGLETTGWTEKTVQLIEENNIGDRGQTSRGTQNSGGVGPYIGSSPTNEPQVQSVRIFGQEFIDSNTNTLTITENDGTLPVNEAQITVYQNGQKLIASQWSVSGSDIIIDSTTHYNGANYEILFTIIL